MAWKKWSLVAVLGAAALTGCAADGGGDDTDAGSGGSGGGVVGGDTGGGGAEPGGQVVPDMGSPDAGQAACADGRDNDGDGLTDGDDPGCDGEADNDENDPPVTPACADMADNDADGYTDFPDDPGCGSSQDTTEENPPQPPQCTNGIDDDHDNLVDEQDPGCASPADPSETDPDEAPVCANGLDDDEDGIVDFPFDPGCRSAGDTDELNPPNAPACADGDDNDSDGLTDYPDDPGCTGAGDADEEDKEVTPACADGIDNDRDNRTDFPEDDGCQAAADYDERGSCGDRYDPPYVEADTPIGTDISRGVFRTHGSCGGQGNPEVAFLYRVDRRLEALEITTVGEGTTVPTTLYVRRTACLDEDAEVGCSREAEGQDPIGNTLRLDYPERGEYYIFVDGVAGEAGPVTLTVHEVDLAECLNGIDDDGNGRVDYPSDPGCDEPDDRDETAPAEPPACANDEDDDGDGAVDYPLDFGCISAAGTSEVDRCGQGVRFQEFPVDREFVLGDTSEGTNEMAGSCGGRNQKEIIYHYSNPFNARLTFSTNHPETMIATVLHVRRDCAAANTELPAPAGCDDGSLGGNQHGRVTIDRAAVGDYWVVVDTRLGAGGPFKLSVEVRRLDPGCTDGRDNDGDGQIDGDDPGCEGLMDEDEADPPRGTPLAQCNNGEDEDADGFIDYPYDPGCVARGDQNEDDPEVQPQCSNGMDDDMDQRIDFPLEPGCQSRGDDNERNPVPAPLCGNAIDDDNDGVADYPQDPGCFAAGDATEQDPPIDPACSDGIDNDRDGIADFPFDPGCFAAGHNDETDPEELPVCSNGEDDDEDGVPDFPRDYGCNYAADPSETGAAFPPQCGNNRDDDGDGRTDFPDDPGCRFAADNDEVNQGQLPPRCNDGVDNDFDGSIDFRDLGCLDAEDDAEDDDPDPAPLCGDGRDNDGDGNADWPDDVGCQARGDLTEDQGCRPEVETPLIARNGSATGATVEGDPDNYRSRCGGRNAPEAVYKYVLEAEADLTFSLDNPGTDFPAVISVRNDCEEPSTMLTCAGNFANPVPTITLNGAAPGEYYVFIDGGGPERWISSGDQIDLPASPDGFQAQHQDLTPQSWGDGGNDAFDGFGTTVLNHNGQEQQLDISIGQRQGQINGYGYTLTSDWAHQNVWRVRIDPQEEFDDRPVTVRITGNMGCDQDCLDPRMVEFEGRTLNYYTSSDQFDPDTVQLLIPSDPEEQDRVRFTNNQDNVTIAATDVKLPIVFYIALTNGDLVAARDAILEDVELQAGPGGPEAARFGNYELTVQEN